MLVVTSALSVFVLELQQMGNIWQFPTEKTKVNVTGLELEKDPSLPMAVSAKSEAQTFVLHILSDLHLLKESLFNYCR